MNCFWVKGATLVYVVMCLCFLIETTWSYSIELEPGDKQCFITVGSSGLSLTGSFEVLSTGATPVVVTLTGPSPDNFVHFKSAFDENAEERDYSEGAFTIDLTADGDYTLCMSNGVDVLGDGQNKLVAFNLRTAGVEQKDYEYVGIQSELLALRQGLDFLKDHQAFMNQREDVHRESLDGISTKVLLWTIMESVILLAMSVWQISYIRSFFETKRRV